MRFSADDACMDVTQSHTVNIATHNMYAERDQSNNVATISRQQDSRILGLTNYKGMNPANAHTFNKSLQQLSVYSFIIFTQQWKP